MEIEGTRGSLVLIIYRGLILCLILLGVMFVGGTIYGLYLKKPSSNTSSFNTNTSNTPSQETAAQNVENRQIFTGIGSMRVSSSDPNPGVVILFISFEYNPGDKAFSEELVLRVRDFRQIIADYIGSFPISGLKPMSEDSIKAELLLRFNSILHLGQIETLFFSDFMIVE